MEPSRLMLCEIWGFHGAGYEVCSLLGYKTPVHTSQETHHISAIEPNRLMLCEIWGFHGADYEECRLLGYKTTVHTSQETHYASAIEPSRLMLCKIWVFTAVTLKNIVLWDVTLCCSDKNQSFGGTFVLTRVTRLNIPKDGFLQISVYFLRGWTCHLYLAAFELNCMKCNAKWRQFFVIQYSTSILNEIQKLEKKRNTKERHPRNNRHALCKRTFHFTLLNYNRDFVSKSYNYSLRTFVMMNVISVNEGRRRLGLRLRMV
jgi:hypothetical protein